jgi:hypothetical protein
LPLCAIFALYTFDFDPNAAIDVAIVCAVLAFGAVAYLPGRVPSARALSVSLLVAAGLVLAVTALATSGS